MKEDSIKESIMIDDTQIGELFVFCFRKTVNI